MKGCRALKGRNDLIHAFDEASTPLFKRTLCGALAAEFSRAFGIEFDSTSPYACKNCVRLVQLIQRRGALFAGRAAFVNLLNKVDKILTRDQLRVLGHPDLKLVDSFYEAEEPLEEEKHQRTKLEDAVKRIVEDIEEG